MSSICFPFVQISRASDIRAHPLPPRAHAAPHPPTYTLISPPPPLLPPPSLAGDKDITTGASSDLDQATRLARAMVTRYGMSDAVGAMAVRYEDEAASLSGETRALIESEIKRLLNAAYERARKVRVVWGVCGCGCV